MSQRSPPDSVSTYHSLPYVLPLASAFLGSHQSNGCQSSNSLTSAAQGHSPRLLQCTHTLIASSMATCCSTAAMSLSAAPAEAPIFLPLAPTRPVRALMLAHGLLLILILPPGASGAFPYDSAPLLCARARGDFRELRSMDPLAEHAPLELFLGPSDPILTDRPP